MHPVADSVAALAASRAASPVSDRRAGGRTSPSGRVRSKSLRTIAASGSLGSSPAGRSSASAAGSSRCVPGCRRITSERSQASRRVLPRHAPVSLQSSCGSSSGRSLLSRSAAEPGRSVRSESRRRCSPWMGARMACAHAGQPMCSGRKLRSSIRAARCTYPGVHNKTDSESQKDEIERDLRVNKTGGG